MSSGLVTLLPVARLVETPGSRSGIDTWIREVIPAARSVGVLLGPPRANAKPVVQVFDESGSTIAFGKVGFDAATAALVRHEAAVLADPGLQRLTQVDVPRVLHAGDWNEMAVLVLSALPAAQDRAPSWQLPVDETVEVAESGVALCSPIGSSDYWSDLSHRIDTLTLSPDAPLPGLMRTIGHRFEGVPLRFGRWHGDWAPWNMGRFDHKLQVWDWERCRDGVPVGFDAIHFVLQGEFRRQSGPGEAVRSLLDSTSPAFERWYSSVEEREATLALYLLEITHRYQDMNMDRPADQLTRRIHLVMRMLAELKTLVSLS